MFLFILFNYYFKLFTYIKELFFRSQNDKSFLRKIITK
jgi:hypothetical protein